LALPVLENNAGRPTSRFYDPTQGKISSMELICGSLRSIHCVESWLSSQDTFIFNTSVRDNIAYAIEGVDEAAIWEALD